MPSARIPADAARWVKTAAFGLPPAWRLAIPMVGQPHRWWFPMQHSVEFAVTFGADEQVEITPPAAPQPAAAPAPELLDAQFRHDPFGTIAALIGRAPCPPGGALAFAASCGDGPMVVMRGAPEDLDRLLADDHAAAEAAHG